MAQISEQVRQAINRDGRTRYRIAMESGVEQGTLSRFMAGADLRLTTVDKLANVLGLSITCSRSKNCSEGRIRSSGKTKAAMPDSKTRVRQKGGKRLQRKGGNTHG